MLRLIGCLLLLGIFGCSTSEVFNPEPDTKANGVTTELQTAYVQNEGIKIEAKVAREENGRFRIDLVVDNGSGFTIDFIPGDIKLIYNGTELKPYSTRFLRNWGYHSATRGTFDPNESAYATATYNSPSGSSQGKVNIEVIMGGVCESTTGRLVQFPKIYFGPGIKENPLEPKPANIPSPKAKS